LFFRHIVSIARRRSRVNGRQSNPPRIAPIAPMFGSLVELSIPKIRVALIHVLKDLEGESLRSVGGPGLLQRFVRMASKAKREPDAVLLTSAHAPIQVSPETVQRTK
jgi:hypothetical protein